MTGRAASRTAQTGPSQEGPGAEVDRLCAAALDALEREDAAGARAAAASAVRRACSLGESVPEGEARLVYGRTLGWSGSLRAGLRQIDCAERLLDGERQGRALVQRSALLYKMGELAAALQAAQRALELLPADAEHDRARALNNIGIVLLYLGPVEQARMSLAEAERLHRTASRPVHAAQTLTNLAMALARLGDLVGALRSFDDAATQLRSAGHFPGQHVVAKADVLLDAGLLRDVTQGLPAVIVALEASGMRVDAAEGLLYLALALVGLGDPAAADTAREARQRFHQVGARGWEAMAGLVEVRARWRGGDVSDGALSAARRAVEALGRRRLRFYELEAQLVRGQLAEALGRIGQSRRCYAEVASERSRGTVRQRALGWEALARLRLIAGNRRGSLRAADAGLRVIERHRDAIGAVDLRAGASSQGMELAALALRLAIDGRRPCAVLRWAERWRAGALFRHPVLPPADSVLAELLTELRRAAVAIRSEAVEGRPVDALERDLARLETAVSDRVRLLAVASEPRASVRSEGGLDLDELRASLAERVLVEYVECDGGLLVVTLDAQTCRIRRLGRADDAAGLAQATAFALRKLARLAAGSPAAPPALAGFSTRLAALRASLLGPVLDLISDRELVVVPTGRLHAIPWQLLVGGDRAVAVAPSAALWQRAASAPRRGGRVVAIAGPGLAGAVQEVDAVRRHQPRSTTLIGTEATVREVNAAIDGAGLVHLAAHGEMCNDNPLFSSFRLTDGPQTVYDLQGLSAAPDVVVLSACNSGLSQVDAGDELLGLVASLLALGTRTAIAAVLPISDLATVPLMDRLHRGIASGEAPGHALLRAGAQLDRDDPGAVAACAAFVCLGVA